MEIDLNTLNHGIHYTNDKSGFPFNKFTASYFFFVSVLLLMVNLRHNMVKVL